MLAQCQQQWARRRSWPSCQFSSDSVLLTPLVSSIKFTGLFLVIQFYKFFQTGIDSWSGGSFYCQHTRRNLHGFPSLGNALLKVWFLSHQFLLFPFRLFMVELFPLYLATLFSLLTLLPVLPFYQIVLIFQASVKTIKGSWNSKSDTVSCAISYSPTPTPEQSNMRGTLGALWSHLLMWSRSEVYSLGERPGYHNGHQTWLALTAHQLLHPWCSILHLIGEFGDCLFEVLCMVYGCAYLSQKVGYSPISNFHPQRHR